MLDGRRSILGSHLDFGDADRGWKFVSPGHGDVDFEALFRVLNRIGYDGPLSVEWEDSGMDREWGAADARQLPAPDRLPALVGRLRRAPSRGQNERLPHAGRRSGAGDVADDRRRHARLRVHGQGPRQRLPDASYMTWPPPLMPELVAIAGRNEQAVAEAARRYGFAEPRDRLARAARRRAHRPVRQLGPQQRPRRADDRRRRGRQARHLREAAGARRRRELRDLAARRRPRASSTCARSTTASSRPCGWRAS